MKRLNIDIETYSNQDLPKVGVYRYMHDPSFEILIFSYAIDGGEVHCIDLLDPMSDNYMTELPTDIIEMLKDPEVIKVAFNAQFERVALSVYCGETLDPAQWHDTMITAHELGLGGGLGQIAKYLKIDQQKDTRGTNLINYFSKPCKPTKANDKRTRNLPEHAPDKWDTYVSYNMQDVRTEMAIAEALKKYPVKASEWELWSMDQAINDRGVGVDIELAEGAVEIMDQLNDAGIEQLKDLTKLDNPNSITQFKQWLNDEGYPFETLGKATVQKALEDGAIDDETVVEALKTRLSLSNSSTKKYQTMLAAQYDDRAHGLMQFYGAGTGRWAGRLIQVQNLPRNYLELPALDWGRSLVKARDTEAIAWAYDSVSDTVKQLIRTALVPKADSKLVICDFSAIEARVISWYANEKWSLEEFAANEDIYKATASRMFGIPKAEIDKKIRQRGKVATLALGYQGGVGALKAMGALDMGIPEDELQGLVDAWRKASPHVVKFWHSVQKGVVKVIKDGGTARLNRGLKAFRDDDFLFIQLPSGRCLAYARPQLEDSDMGPRITYMGKGLKVGYSKIETYGGKLVENIVQATARDLLAQAMLRLMQNGYPIVFHVHDEVVSEVPDKDEWNVAEMRSIMCQPLDWAEGLPLNAAGFETKYYRKD